MAQVRAANRAREILEETSSVLTRLSDQCTEEIAHAASFLVEAYQANGKVLVFGNGGSASDALHIQGELGNRFLMDRRPLGCLALVGGPALLTAIANDVSYEEVFSRQVEALAKPEDVVIGISTSGTSKNVLEGLKAARTIGCRTIGLTGGTGGDFSSLVDLCLTVPSSSTPRIQEGHITIAHIICELVEQELFGSPGV